MSPVPIRTRPRPHIKSRSGCRNCKRRKVKCDEHTPSCRNCAKRDVECDLSTTTKTPSSTKPIGLPSAPLNATINTGLTVLDLELLHHYTISTSLTLSSDPVVRNYFQVDVPQLAFKHHYVLQSILSLAALHLARYRPDMRRQYSSEATTRHTVATSIATPLLSGITPDRAIPMYSFSIMTLFISFASLHEDDALFFDADNVVPSWLNLFRGVRTVLESNNGSIFSSSVAYLFQTMRDVNEIWTISQSDLTVLMDLQKQVEQTPSSSSLSTSPSTSTPEDVDPVQSRKQQLLQAISELRRAFFFFYHNNDRAGSTNTIESNNNNNHHQHFSDEVKFRAIFTWMYRLSDGYINMLRQRDDDALCILAFFCVLLHKLDYHWWMKGWGTHLISRIYAAIGGAHRWRIRWQIQEIGWVPA